MGFLVLLVLGAVLGWLASIVVLADNGSDVARNVATGAGGALIGSALVSTDSLLVGVSPAALLAGIVVAAIALGGLNFARFRTAR